MIRKVTLQGLALAAALIAVSPALAAAPAIPPGAPFPAPYAQSSLTTGNALSALVTNPITAGLIAEYPMTEGAGTVVHDISGNGNTANFGASTAAPAWSTYGLQFNDTTFATYAYKYVQTPVKTWLTVVLHVCPATNPQNSGTAIGSPFPEFPTLLGPAGGTDGVLIDSAPSTAFNYVGAVMPSLYKIAAATVATTPSAPMASPCGVLTVALGASDHIYWNGVEIAYATQGTVASVVTTTTAGYQIGAGGNFTANNLWNGTINYAAFYSSALSAAQVAQVSTFINYQVSNRPGFPQSIRSTSATPQIICSGDSVTAAYPGGSWCNTTYTVTNNTYAFNDWGIAGQQAQTEAELAPYRHLTGISPNAGRNICLEWLGSNSMAFGWSVPATWSALQTLAAEDLAAGCVPVISTMISRSGNDTHGNTLDADKNLLNGLIRAGWKQAGFAALDDVAAIPALGADGAHANTTSPACFYSDQVHLTGGGAGGIVGSCFNSLTGYGAVGAQAAKVINILDGSTKDAPTKQTSNAYTMAYSDVWLRLAPTANGTVVLPDCTGLTGAADYHIANDSGSYTETVSAANGLSITGSTTISANSNAEYVCQLTGASAGGNYYARVSP